jgi:hypothetical protein
VVRFADRQDLGAAETPRPAAPAALASHVIEVELDDLLLGIALMTTQRRVGVATLPGDFELTGDIRRGGVLDAVLPAHRRQRHGDISPRRGPRCGGGFRLSALLALGAVLLWRTWAGMRTTAGRRALRSSRSRLSGSPAIASPYCWRGVRSSCATRSAAGAPQARALNPISRSG